MIKMNPLVVPITILAILSAANADVSHLNNQHQNPYGGYEYHNLGLTSKLSLHTPERNPAPTQYFGTYGDPNTANQLPTSYSPQPSGSPFGSIAPLPRTYLASLPPPPRAALPTPQLATPFQAPAVATQQFGTYTNFQNQQRFGTQNNFQNQQRFGAVTNYQTPAVTTPRFGAVTNYQTPSVTTPRFGTVTNYQTPSVTTPRFVAATNYQTPSVTTPRFGAQTSFQTQQQYQPTYQQSRAIEAPSYQTQNQATFQTAQSNNHALAYAQQSQEPIITKHFYVHAAPEDPEEDVGPRFVQTGRPQKNYKIIFIKPPTYGLKSQIIALPPKVEDKTIVYVLSKKPTFEQNIQIPPAVPTVPSKPDVFFIKYKTKEEAEQAQQSIQAAYDQANLAGSENVDHIAAQFGASGGKSTEFGGQDLLDQQNQQQNANGGQLTSTQSRTKRTAA